DPEYPEERIRFMLEDSDAEILLTQSWLSIQVAFGGETIYIDDALTFEGDTTDVEKVNNANDLAYVIYTSGSTGRPKGVMVEHQAAINRLNWMQRVYPLNERDVILQKTPITFDVSVWELFWWSFAGASLYLLEPGGEKEPSVMLRTIEQQAITVMHFVPSMLGVFMNYAADSGRGVELCSLRYVFASGEALKPAHVTNFYSLMERKGGQCQLINLYGPTEATVDVSYYDCPEDREDTIPIGKPIHNIRLYIVDERMRPQPIGVSGELCISGAGVARGYLNRPELAAEKFVPNPFIRGERMYRTGDLARWLPDGNIEFMGRIDDQVKIRGFRIELGEIESRVLELESIKEAVVTAREDESGDKYLCAYIVSEEEIPTSRLRSLLSENLPDYMIPTYLVRLERLPLTPNGKVDRKALPEPENGASTEYVAPRNATEEVLTRIWSEVLGREKVGIYDNFFELGGHSLKGTVLVSRIHKELNIEIPLKELFRVPTIAGLNEYIGGAEESAYTAIEQVVEKEYYEASYIQKRMWILNRLQPDSPAFNIAGHTTIFEEADIVSMQKALDKLVDRHEAFRTRFEERDGVLVQFIDKEGTLKIDIIDMTACPAEGKAREREKIFEIESSKIFNLKEGQLITVKLVRVEKSEYDLIFCMHHIISDGWSIEILKKEFFLLYEAYKHERECKLVPLRIQYKDFAKWQNKLIEDKEFSRAAKMFWHEQLKGEIPVLDLPRKHQINVVDDKTGSRFRIFIANEERDALKKLAQSYQVSFFDVLLSTFISFLSDLTKQSDILIGAAVFGREHVDLQNVIGCFINTTIFRNEINKEGSFIDLLKKVNENTLSTLKYQSYPLELVAEELKIKYPEISVFLNMLNFSDSIVEYTDSLNSEHLEKVQDVKFDLEWYIIEYTNAVQIDCVYSRKHFKSTTIEYIMSKYIQFVAEISKDPDRQLKDYFISDK
ncbi:MAG: amino acid adenylation domain-containing protein, partial [Bacillota bacterium]